MYSNKKVMNDFPMKRLVPFFNSGNNTRRYSYTDGMTLRNETRRQYQQQSSNNNSVATHKEKLQKKLIQSLEANYEINKKYGNILPTTNEYSPNSKSYSTSVERKRSAALVILRKRTNNVTNGSESSSNNNRKASIDDNIENDKITQRQQALSVLKRRVGNKRNDNNFVNSINNEIKDYSFDNGNSTYSSSLNSSFGKRMDIPSPSTGFKNHETSSPYFGSLLNYDMTNSPTSISGMPNLFNPVDMSGSPSLNALKAYDMTSSNNVSNTLSPLSPSFNFINGFGASKNGINLDNIGPSNKIFENNRLITNDPFLYDISSCPTSPINFSNNGPLFMSGNNTSLSSFNDEADQKIAENQKKIDHLYKLCNGINGDINDYDSSLYTSNLYSTNTTSKLPPTAPIFLNNELNMNDFSINSPPPFNSSSTNSSPSPSQKFVENDSPLIIGSQAFKNLNLNPKKFSLDSSMANINNFPSPYANNNKIINSNNITMPTSPYLSNAKVNIASPFPNNNSNNNNNINVNVNVNANISVNGLTSPTFNPSSSPYLGVNIDKNQSYKRNQSNSPYINGIIGKGIPSPSPSFSNNNNNTSNSNIKYMNNASPGLYSVNASFNEISPPTFLFNDNSFDLQQQIQPQQSQQSQQNTSQLMPPSANVNQNQNQNKRKSVSSMIDQCTYLDNKINIMPKIYNNNSTVQMSQSMLPAYTSTTNASTSQIPSPNIGAIGSLRHSTTKLVENNDDYKKMNSLMAAFASEKQKSSPLLNSNLLSEDFSQLTLGNNNTSTLLSSRIPINNFNLNNNSNQEVSSMEPKPTTNNIIGNKSPYLTNNLSNFNRNSISFDEFFFPLNENSMEQTYKLFDKNILDNTINKSNLQTLSNFESTNVIQKQSLEDSPIINSIEDKTYNNFNNIDMQLTSDALSNNNSNSNVYSLSIQHPVLS